MEIFTKDGALTFCETEGIKQVFEQGRFVPVILWVQAKPAQTEFSFGDGTLIASVPDSGYELEVPFISPNSDGLSLAQKLIQRLHELPGDKAPGTRLDVDGNVVCYYTGRPLREGNIHVDHVTPRCRGGHDIPENLVVSGETPNEIKNGRDPVHWLMREMANVPDDIVIDYVARLLYHSMIGYNHSETGE